jgi:hypothetical protein
MVAYVLSAPCAMVFGIFKYRRSACTHILFLWKAELGFLHFLEIVTGWYLLWVRRSQYSLAGTFYCKRSRLLKTGFFRQVRELKIQKKNSGSPFCGDSPTVLVEN